MRQGSLPLPARRRKPLGIEGDMIGPPGCAFGIHKIA